MIGFIVGIVDIVGYIFVGIDGSVQVYDVVIFGNKDFYINIDGILIIDNIIKLYLQKDGFVINGLGKVVYVEVDGDFIIDVVIKVVIIIDLLVVLDDVISQIDKFCLFLGVIQNCLDFVVINLNNIIINLFEVQFCIQDVDYVIEVFNMLKVQIIQQVGNFVLVKVNQVLQQVLFLLQG